MDETVLDLRAMLGLLRRNWWTLVLRGACAIAFGMFAWFWPRMTVLVLLLAWGTLACLGGIATLIGTPVATWMPRITDSGTPSTTEPTTIPIAPPVPSLPYRCST